MARPREGNDIKRTIRQKGDRFYAYQVTSVMENGKKKTVSKYLGRYDPETDRVLEKIPERSRESRERSAKRREAAILDETESFDYGGVHLMDGIQHRMGLGQDLDSSFGSASVLMMALAITLVQCHGVLDSVAGTMNRTWTSRYYGTGGGSGPDSLRGTVEEIGLKASCNIEAFFSRRIARNGGESVAWIVDSGAGNGDVPSGLGLATDLRGIPLMYRRFGGDRPGMDSVESLAEDFAKYGGRAPLFVMDRGCGSDMRSMLRNGRRFVMPAMQSSKGARRLLTGFGRAEGKTDMEHEGRMYTVWETEVDADDDWGGGRGIPASGHADEGPDRVPGRTVKAFVCFDSEKYSEDVQARMRLVSGLKRKAAEVDCEDPVTEFRRIAGKAAALFDIEASGRRAVVTEKRNSRSFNENRAGLFTVLASDDVSWETMMQARRARELAEGELGAGVCKAPAQWTESPDSVQGREFLRFLCLTLRCGTAAELRGSEMPGTMSVDAAMSMADCIQAKRYRSTTTVGGIDADLRELFDRVHVQVPDEVETGVPLFDLPADERDPRRSA